MAKIDLGLPTVFFYLLVGFVIWEAVNHPMLAWLQSVMWILVWLMVGFTVLIAIIALVAFLVIGAVASR